MSTKQSRNILRVSIGILGMLIMVFGMKAQTAFAADVDHSTKSIALQRDMRQLWEDHVLWTRIVIISIAGNLKDRNAATDRLMRNQVDIGNAIKPYYGNAAGNKLTSLLKDHIKIAAELVVAAKAGNTSKANDAKRRWYQSGDTIAIFLSKANPRYWPLSATKPMMKKHLDTTLNEADARLRGNWRADVAAFDKARMHVLMMADTLSVGIIHQFPAKFAENKDDSIQADMVDSSFIPWEIDASPGTTITWLNNGELPHTVIADSTNRLSGGPDSSAQFPNGIRPGASFSWTVPYNASSGDRWYFHCAFHGSAGDGRSIGAGMSGVVIVR